VFAHVNQAALVSW